MLSLRSSEVIGSSGGRQAAACADGVDETSRLLNEPAASDPALQRCVEHVLVYSFGRDYP